MAAPKGTLIVTGANGGLGSALAEQIALRSDLSSYKTLYIVRDATSAPALTAALEHGAASYPHETISLDLTDLDAVRKVAGDVNARISQGQLPPIRALILSAGFQDFGKQTWTGDGFDVTFMANYLGHWLLTLLLLGSLNKESGRIVILGSQAHDPEDKRNATSKAFVEDKHKIFVTNVSRITDIAKGLWSSAKEDPSFRGSMRRYGAAKLLLVMMLHELQHRMNEDATLRNIRVLGVDPGTMVSGLQRHATWPIRILVFRIIYSLTVFLSPNNENVRSTQRSASDVLQAAFGSAGAQGDVYFNGNKPSETSAESRNRQKRILVWSESAKLAKLTDGETVLHDWR